MSITIFQNFCLLSQSVQEVKNKIDTEEMTQQNRTQLHKEVENIHASLDIFREEAQEMQGHVKAQFSQLEEMESQIISLYREIEEKFEGREISLIARGALTLCSTLEKGDMKAMAKKADSLKQNILFLYKQRRPSLQNRKIIHLAMQMVDHANGSLMKNGKEHLQLILLLKVLLQESIAKADALADPMEAELAMELYEVADLLYSKDTQAGLKLNLLLPKLTRAQQDRLNAANSEEEKIQILLEIVDGGLQTQTDPTKRQSVIHELLA